MCACMLNVDIDALFKIQTLSVQKTKNKKTKNKKQNKKSKMLLCTVFQNTYTYDNMNIYTVQCVSLHVLSFSTSSHHQLGLVAAELKPILVTCLARDALLFRKLFRFLPAQLELAHRSRWFLTHKQIFSASRRSCRFAIRKIPSAHAFGRLLQVIGALLFVQTWLLGVGTHRLLSFSELFFGNGHNWLHLCCGRIFGLFEGLPTGSRARGRLLLTPIATLVHCVQFHNDDNRFDDQVQRSNDNQKGTDGLDVGSVTFAETASAAFGK
jgi:hypothetical protein